MKLFENKVNNINVINLIAAQIKKPLPEGSGQKSPAMSESGQETQR
ncbi:hypothetical protein P2G53_02955 [Neptuniibacter sp. CAU 1671]|nr:hypothetical protein [Neptuniibacter sp. CAU 1671]